MGKVSRWLIRADPALLVDVNLAAASEQRWPPKEAMLGFAESPGTVGEIDRAVKILKPSCRHVRR